MRDSLNISRLSFELEKALIGNRYEPAKDDIKFDDIPWLSFPKGYSIRVIFPFGGAAARFQVCKTGKPKNSVSVYLDTREMLGYFGAPYWEAYPIGDDVARFAMSDVDSLIKAIIKQLKRSKG